jgi:hypothetical protein
MGGKPSTGTPADQRLSENQNSGSSSRSSSSDSGTRVTASSKPSDNVGGNDRPFDTFMPWASQ